MAEYKDYIVRYDIQANTAGALEGLENLGKIASKYQSSMTAFADAIKQVSDSAKLLKTNSNIVFEPTINVKTFNSQLRQMLADVKSASAEMRAAIYEALSGNSPATKAMQTGAKKTLDAPRTIADIKKDIESYQKELDKLLGTRTIRKGKTIRSRDGAILMAKNAGNNERVAKLESDKQMYKELIKQRSNELAEAERLEKEVAAKLAQTSSKTLKTTSGTVTSARQQAKLTNVTPAVIKEWKKAFGDTKGKTLTVNIKGNASGVNGALTIIKQVQDSLKTLQEMGTFNIKPILNTESFATAEAQLKRLASLTSSVTAPFIAKDERAQGSKLGVPVSALTKDEKAKLSDARKQIANYQSQIDRAKSRLEVNKKIKNPSSGIKGQITKDNNAIAKYEAEKTRQEDVVKNLQGKTGTVVQASTKGIKPLSIDIVGNLKGINVVGKTPVVPIIGELTKIQGKVTESIPVNVKIMSDQVAASIKSIRTPSLNVNVRLNTDGIAQQLQSITTPSTAKTTVKGAVKSVARTEGFPAKGVTSQPKMAALKNATLITEGIDTKNIISQIKSIPRQTIPVAVKLIWERGGIGKQEQFKRLANQIPPVTIKLDTSAAIAKFEEFIALIKSNSVQNIRLTVSGNASNATASATSKTTSVIVNANNKNIGSNSSIAKGKDLTPQERYAKLKENAVKNAERAKAGGNQMVLKGKEYKAKEQAWRTQQQAMYDRLFEAVPKPDYGWINRAKATRASELARMREDAVTAFAAPTPFEQKNPTPQERYAKLKEDAEKRAKKANIGGSPMVQRGREIKANEQAWYAQRQAMYNRLFEAVPKPDYGWAQRIEAQRNSELLKMREDARAAFAKPTPFEQQETVARNVAVQRSIARHNQQAERLRAMAYNEMLPFAQNKEQATMMAKNRKYFRQAVSATGITPSAGMTAPQILKYLQGVSGQMKSANVAVPWQLQNQINKLQRQVAKSGNLGGTGSSSVSTRTVDNQKPFFDQSRKWAYPFTGQTSFGTRTPMAVDMAKGMGVMYAVGGAMSAIGDSFSQAMEYQNMMGTTKAILQHGTDSYSKSSFKNMESIIRDVGIKTKFSAPEVASAAKFLAMAGYDIEAINASIRPIADLALIGDSDLGETADKMTNIMTTFQIKPEKMRAAANIMATTATRSNTDLMMLAESAKYGGGVANMYGRNDPNLFADTMALFGVMGNAGVQGSSAGTALRMMYQNIFKPNKNQKAVLDMMEKDYKISTVNKDGSFRPMSDILVDMAQQIPEAQMPKIVGNLFRITAQPGATAALLAASGGDANIAEEIGAGIDALADKMSNNAGLSSLVSLMLANRNSMNGNISGGIAEEKQGTVKGLWAQVTSTFTEGVLRAFEQKQGGFEEILKKLRDYFAKPETIQMIGNLIDMIAEIGKVLAWFAKIWAGLYNTAPKMIKFWVMAQMALTQIGSLISPVIQLIGVFDRLGGTIARLTGVSITGGTAIAGAMTGRRGSGAVARNVPFVVNGMQYAYGKNGVRNAKFNVGDGKYIYGKTAFRANRELAANAVLAGELALSGALRSDTLKKLNEGTRQHYAEVRRRANNIYGFSRAGRAFKTTFFNIPTMMAFAPIVNGIKSMFFGLFTSIAKAIGFIFNPTHLLVAAFTGLGFAIYKTFKFINGTTEAQLLLQQEMVKNSADSMRAIIDSQQWYQEQLDKFKNNPQSLYSADKTKKEIERENNAKNLKEKFLNSLNELDNKNFNDDLIDKHIADLRKRFDNPLFKAAIGKDYDKLLGKGLEIDNSYLDYTGGEEPFFSKLIYNTWFGTDKRRKNVQNKEVQALLRVAGADSPAIQVAHKQISDLYEKFLSGKINEDEYIRQAEQIRDSIANPYDETLRSSEGLTAKQINEDTDLTVYREYVLGQYNVLNSFINADIESLTGKLKAYHELRNGIEVYTNQWWNAIGNVIPDFPLKFHAVSDDGKKFKDIELRLSLLPNNKIDYTKIINQVREGVDNFNGTLQDFANMYATVYKMMADKGLVPNTKEGALSWMQFQMPNIPVTAADAISFYDNNIADTDPVKKYKKTAVEWKNHIANPNDSWIIAGKTYSSANDIANIRNTFTNQAINRAFGEISKFNGSGPLRPGVQANEGNGENKQTNQTPPLSPTNQHDYASKYERASAKPTQINIHINELAHFDRTTVASSAEERELVESMESKITEAVYRIFAEASNHAQSAIDMI